MADKSHSLITVRYVINKTTSKLPQIYRSFSIYVGVYIPKCEKLH
jgi:hypothetical protein